MDAVRFQVEYRFAEYRGFLFEHMKGMKEIPRGFFMRLLLECVAAIQFARKKRRMPLCEFAIDENGIRRRAGGGELVMPWDKFHAVHRYGPGYFIDKGTGSVVIPYRCLDGDQREALEALFAAHVPPR